MLLRDAVSRCRRAAELSGGSILVGLSGGKDSVHGDSVVWVRRSGLIERTTPARLRSELRAVAFLEADGRIVLRPSEPLEILTASDENQRLARAEFQPVEYMMAHAVTEPLFEFTLAGGRTLRTTGDHSVMTGRARGKGIVAAPLAARDVKLGDMMLEATDLAFDSPEVDVPDWLLRLGGLWIADGCYALNRKIVISTGHNVDAVAFLRQLPREKTKCERAVIAYAAVAGQYATLRETVAAVAAQARCTESDARNAINRGAKRMHENIYVKVNKKGDAWICDKALVDRMQALGFVGKSHTKRVPAWLFTASRRQVGLFLAGYIDGDGCYPKRGGLQISSVNRALLEDVRDLLARIGVPCGIGSTSRVGGFRTKSSALYGITASSDSGIEALRRWVPAWKQVQEREGTRKSWYSFRAKLVVAIRRVEAAVVYDFEVAGRHTFLADGVLVHNSLATLDVLVRSQAFTRVECFSMYLVKGLDLFEAPVRAAAARYNLPLHFVPHWDLGRLLKHAVLRPHIVGAEKLRQSKAKDVQRALTKRTKISWFAYGEKGSDSFARLFFTRHEDGVRASQGRLYVIRDWKDSDVYAYLKARRIPVPQKIGNRKTSGISLEPQDLAGIKARSPSDYRKIVACFPFAEVQLRKYERQQKAEGHHGSEEETAVVEAE